jgi:hypothetical protein
MTDSTDIRQIPLHDVVNDGSAQMRVAGIDPATVAEYAEAMLNGAVFPAIIVYFDGKAYWPGDGFHRIEAAKSSGIDTILAEVRRGTSRDAIVLAAGANAAHGLRRTAADKRRSVETLLKDKEWRRWSDREIGKACAVDHKTVGKIRRELSGEIPTDTHRAVTYRDRHGNVSEMKVNRQEDPVGVSMTERLLTTISKEVLIAECRRRGLEVVE